MHPRLIKRNSAAYPIFFKMIDSTDHRSGKTGLSPTVTISKDGAAHAAPSGAITEVAFGWYQVAGNATDTGTLGVILLHATATGADDADEMAGEVVAFDPQSATDLGLSTLTGNVPQTGDAYAIVNHASYGNAKLVRSTTPANTLNVSATGEADANVTKVNGTAATTAGTIDSNVTKWSGTAVAAVDTAGYPKVTLKSGTGSGELSLSAGLVTLAGVTHTGAVIPSVTTVTGNVDGSVGSVTAAVTVGTNTDKTGYSLAASQTFSTTGAVGSITGITFPTNFASLAITSGGYVTLAAAGLDQITVETGINARQALSPILSASAGVLAGAATTSITIAAASNPGTNRITATVDASGNRSAVTLSLPS